MENGNPAANSNGTDLNLGAKKILSFLPAQDCLKLYEPLPKNRLRSACKSIVTDSSGQRLIPTYNILWLEVSKGKLVLDYAAQPTKTSVKHESWTFDLASETESQGPRPDQFVIDVLAHAYRGSQLRRGAYVLINPHSGPGGALRKWNKFVLPLFQAARMELEVVTLKRGGEATDLAEKADIDKYDTIIACSGDGTPHEIFNGLAKRPDAARALSKIAVSHIPCGSGNAMSCNLYGTYRVAPAALAIIKGRVTALDLVSITQGTRRFVSFLSQALGIVAESDLGTENLRWMGGSRFEVGMIMRIFRRRCYPCDLAVKVEVADKEEIKAHHKRAAEDRTIQQKLLDNGVTDLNSEGLPPLRYGTVQDPLPEGWELAKHDKIGNFYCGNMAYMAPNANFFPAALANDGCMDLVTINGDLSPMAATKLLYSVESGKFFDNAYTQYKKISAYRIIPRDQEDGYISIDGERVPFEPFQAEIHRGLGRVISKGGKYEAPGPAN